MGSADRKSKYQRKIIHLQHMKTYLNSEVPACPVDCVVDVRLFPRANTPVNLTDNLATEELKDYHPRPRVHHLLGRRPVSLITRLVPGHNMEIMVF